MVALSFFSDVWDIPGPLAWNAVFRAIGIDGVVDYDNGEGEGEGIGIIHTSEPTQAVFFSIGAVKNVKRLENVDRRPGRIKQFREYGQLQHQQMLDVAAKLRAATTAQEVSDILDATYWKYIRLVRNPELRTLAIDKKPYLIQYVSKPSDEEQLFVLRIDLSNVRYIINPKEELVLSVLKKQKPSEYELGVIARKFPNASEKLQSALVKYKSEILQTFKKPHPDVVKAVLRDHEQQGTPQPKWLLRLAISMNLPFTRIEPYSVIEQRRVLKTLEERNKTLLAKLEYITSNYENALSFSSDPEFKKTVLHYQKEETAKVQKEIDEVQLDIKETRELIERLLAL